MKLTQTLANTFTAPGFGVHTVSTGSGKRKKISQILYPDSKNETEVLENWKKSLDLIPSHNGVFVYGIPSDTGGGIQRGANWGPLAVRETLYLQLSRAQQKNILDLGDVRVNPQLLLDEYLNDHLLSSCKKAMYDDAHSTYSVSPLSIAADALRIFHHQYPEKKIFMIGGDHSVSYPAVKEFLKLQKSRNQKTAVIHFDAHTDLLDERMGIPVCFGSWASHILSELDHPSLLVQVGIRSSSKDQTHWEKVKGVTQFWSKDVNAHGPSFIAESIISKLKSLHVDLLYITFDIDSLDMSEASATGTPESAGLMTDDCVSMIQLLAKSFPVGGADLTEVAPFVHHPDLNRTEKEPTQTLNNASKIAAALLNGLIKFERP
jgi:agmatinase